MDLRENFVKLLRSASPNNPSTSLNRPSEWLSSLWGGTPSKTGVRVNSETALSFSAVYACVRVISETIASLPLNVMVRDEEGNRTIAYDHPIQKLLHSEPNKNMSSFQLREMLQARTLLKGNSYGLIIRDNGALPISIEPINQEVKPIVYQGDLFYQIGESSTPVLARDIIHIPALSYDGIVGKSPIMVAKESIGLGLAAQEFGSSFFGNGANMSGVLEHPNALSDEAAKRVKASWDAAHAGLDKAQTTALLEEGMKYQRISIAPNDAQFIETRKFQVNEIARLYRVPPHMIQDLERATFSNIEAQSIEFVTHTIRPWLVRWEQELNRKIFKESEKGTHFVKFNIDGLLRGDAKSRADYYRTMFNVGALSQNDIRRLENMNAIEDGDKYFVQTNMAPSESITNEE